MALLALSAMERGLKADWRMRGGTQPLLLMRLRSLERSSDLVISVKMSSIFRKATVRIVRASCWIPFKTKADNLSSFK